LPVRKRRYGAGRGAALTENHVHRQGTNGKVTGEYLSNRYMVSTNMDSNFALTDNWVISPRTGLLVAWDHRRNFTESDGTRPLKNDSGLLEGKLGGRLTCLMGQWDLFGGVDYLYDFLQDQDITSPNQYFDRDEYLMSMGATWHSDENETFGLEFDNSMGRAYTREWTLLANYRKTF
jgi:outer membrane autotransporter protein